MSEERIKVFFVESIDPYNNRSIVGHRGFFDEFQARALEAEKERDLGKIYSFYDQEIYVEFSHRNGETDDPEIDGFYWVEYLGIWTIEFNPYQSRDQEIESSHFWGPIPMPEKV